MLLFLLVFDNTTISYLFEDPSSATSATFYVKSNEF